MEVNKLMEETHAYYQEKYNILHQENINLRKKNNKLKGQVRGLKRYIYKLKQTEKEKKHYKNGKRGTKFNG